MGRGSDQTVAWSFPYTNSARLGLLYSVSSVGAQLRDNITLTVMATSSSSTAES